MLGKRKRSESQACSSTLSSNEEIPQPKRLCPNLTINDTLPYEVLSKILVYSLFDSFKVPKCTTFMDDVKNLTKLYNLLKVCRRWYHVIFNEIIPTIWYKRFYNSVDGDYDNIEDVAQSSMNMTFEKFMNFIELYQSRTTVLHIKPKDTNCMNASIQKYYSMGTAKKIPRNLSRPNCSIVLCRNSILPSICPKEVEYIIVCIRKEKVEEMMQKILDSWELDEQPKWLNEEVEYLLEFDLAFLTFNDKRKLLIEYFNKLFHDEKWFTGASSTMIRFKYTISEPFWDSDDWGNSHHREINIVTWLGVGWKIPRSENDLTCKFRYSQY